ncbi:MULTISPECIES: hypothetical protein [Cryobacterium]|uniref:Uncharacterized protein n=1 Tax=Cryobacterium glucosi TaxID=1259175 RepID=A0ABY2ISA4_9MICO|nr:MULTISPECIES: hypothetical protein [Cryobacterium]MDY7527405.1 hypothetical protein [Cryobacterium sp. 10C2]MDY7556809.1 hypothetical protein [Cryobacterium sp. 10C3]MEB0003637.1 hypothetical protein [Cryobacterium sp. RTC2.1]MEB0202296.1 hypothetical protein [Cryobacterium sp. 5I3]MEB0286474.1 hypothetical protein [Cryobacterium sp. 10S3]
METSSDQVRVEEIPSYSQPADLAQVLDLAAAQGGFVELTFPEAGRYPFVSHVMSDAEKGARGVLAATP